MRNDYLENVEEMDSVEVAKQTMIGDLVQASLDELKAAPNVWQKLSQAKQDEVIERLTHRVVHNVTQAIHIIASDDRPVIRAALEQITVKNGVKAVLQLSKQDPAFHDLADATGEEVLIVLPHVEEYANQETGLAGEPDQRGLPIDGEGSNGNRVTGALTPAIENGVDLETGETEDPLLENAIEHVVNTRKATISGVQRKLKIGYNRAATMLNRMEQLGIVSPAGHNGAREVYQQPGNDEGVAGDGFDQEVPGMPSFDELMAKAREAVRKNDACSVEILAEATGLPSENYIVLLNNLISRLMYEGVIEEDLYRSGGYQVIHSKDLPEGFSDVVEHVSWVGVFGKAMLEKYDGPQARAIEKALIDEGIIGATAYNGAHMVLIDKPENVHETSLQAVERAVKNMKEVRVSDVANVSGLVGDANELLLQALEARGVVTRESDTGLRVVLSGGES